VLALVLVHPDDRVDGPHYVTRPFGSEPDWGTATVTYHIKHLLQGREAMA